MLKPGLVSLSVQYLRQPTQRNMQRRRHRIELLEDQHITPRLDSATHTHCCLHQGGGSYRYSLLLTWTSCSSGAEGPRNKSSNSKRLSSPGSTHRPLRPSRFFSTHRIKVPCLQPTLSAGPTQVGSGYEPIPLGKEFELTSVKFDHLATMLCAALSPIYRGLSHCASS